VTVTSRTFELVIRCIDTDDEFFLGAVVAEGPEMAARGLRDVMEHALEKHLGTKKSDEE